jgi:hypothetical protein
VEAAPSNEQEEAMTYAVKRHLGYGPWGVTNPWVYANLAQPQRRRVPSKYVWQTHPPREGMHPLGAIGQVVADLMSPEARATRMEIYSLCGLGLTTIFVLSPAMAMMSNKNRKKRKR